MDWNLNHYKLQSYGECPRVGELAEKDCTQVSNLTWLSGQPAQSSSETMLIDEIVVIDSLLRSSYYRASGCESCWTHILLKHPPNFVVYDDANIINDCFDHYDAALPW